MRLLARGLVFVLVLFTQDLFAKVSCYHLLSSQEENAPQQKLCVHGSSGQSEKEITLSFQNDGQDKVVARFFYTQVPSIPEIQAYTAGGETADVFADLNIIIEGIFVATVPGKAPTHFGVCKIGSQTYKCHQ